MTAELYAVIPLSPPPTNRPRLVKRGKHAGLMTPPNVTKWRAQAAPYVEAQRPDEPYTSAVHVDLVVVLKRPQRLLTKRHHDGLMWATVTPDVDNTAKVVLDLVTQLCIWPDDNIVCGLTVYKLYAERTGTPRLELTIRDAPEGRREIGGVTTFDDPIFAAEQPRKRSTKGATDGDL